MTTKFSVPRGTADLLPQMAPIWQNMEAKARRVIQSYGYREIRTPFFEDTELFARSMGQSSEVVSKQMLNLAAQGEKAKLSGLSLRPENTASVVRSYIENRFDKKEALSKFFYIGPQFRGERPQKGRLRQFHQIGVEAIGVDTALPQLDAEVISCAIHLLKEFGIKKYCVRINTLGSTQDKEFFSQKLRDLIEPYIKDLDKADQDRFDRNVFRVLDSKSRKTQSVLKKIDLSKVQLSKESQEYFAAVLKALDRLEIEYVVDATLVRGLDYYTHTVFEITSESLGSQDALGAGGRYNDLVENLGGPKVDACGFALGMERILLALGELKEISVGVDAFIISLDESTFEFGFQWAHKLRQAGISTDLNYRLGSMKSQMRQANKAQARFVILIGDEEMKKQTFTVKHMETGEQKEIAQENLISHLKDK